MPTTCMNNRMENIYVGAAKDVLGIAKRTSKPWLSDWTWKKVEERRQLKLKLESTRSERVKKRIKERNPLPGASIFHTDPLSQPFPASFYF